MQEHSRWQTSRCLPHGRTDDVFALPGPGKRAGAASCPGNPVQAGAARVEQNRTCAVQADCVSSWWIVVIWAIAYSSWVSQLKLKTSPLSSNEFVCVDRVKLEALSELGLQLFRSEDKPMLSKFTPFPGLDFIGYSNITVKKPWLTLPTQTWQFLKFSSKICFVLAVSGHKETLPHPLHSIWG